MSMNLQEFSSIMRPAIESEMQRIVAMLGTGHFDEFRGMMAYHLGWEGEGVGGRARGKRIRPILALISTAAAGKNWEKAIPASVAVELIHNFSLIHDDIEDQSDYRHGRKTVWSIWGEGQAVNTGDCMFTLAFKAVIQSGASCENVISAVDLLQETCVLLTKGQFLDMAYEQKDNLPLDAYWHMVGGKTAALLACSAAIGATLTGAKSERIKTLREFGWNLGLAFQAQDDWLGIWGDTVMTGKSTESDLMSGKKGLPVLLGLLNNGEFKRRWVNRPFRPDEIPELAGILIDEGIQIKVEEEAAKYTHLANEALDKLDLHNDAYYALHELADGLLSRKN
jgi:geranylgeranyl diphosphate synthase type I